MKNQIAVMTKPAPMMPKMAKIALVGTLVGGTMPSPGRQFGFVLSSCLLCKELEASFWLLESVERVDVRVLSKVSANERIARSLTLLPERFAMERREVRDVEMVSGTGAMVLVVARCVGCVGEWNG